MVFILYKLYVLLPYTYPTPKLSPHRRRCISIFPQKTHSVWFISVLNYGDTENVLINHLLLVIPMSYPCHYTNLCPHKPHKHAHTHTHTHIYFGLVFPHKNFANTHTHIYFLDTHIHTHTHTRMCVCVCVSNIFVLCMCVLAMFCIENKSTLSKERKSKLSGLNCTQQNKKDQPRIETIIRITRLI